MVYGVWCMVYGVWCMVYGVWCMVPLPIPIGKSATVPNPHAQRFWGRDFRKGLKKIKG
jgi:hypothetical protein